MRPQVHVFFQYQRRERRGDRGPAQIQFGLGEACFGLEKPGPGLGQLGLAQGQIRTARGLPFAGQYFPFVPGHFLIAAFQGQIGLRLLQRRLPGQRGQLKILGFQPQERFSGGNDPAGLEVCGHLPDGSGHFGPDAGLAGRDNRAHGVDDDVFRAGPDRHGFDQRGKRNRRALRRSGPGGQKIGGEGRARTQHEQAEKRGQELHPPGQRFGLFVIGNTHGVVPVCGKEKWVRQPLPRDRHRPACMIRSAACCWTRARSSCCSRSR